MEYVEWVEHVARAVAARLAVATHASTFEFTDRDQFRIFVYKWEPTQPAKAAVQIAHGATEHALRYQRVAAFPNDHGYVAYANDHRGHGRTAMAGRL